MYIHVNIFKIYTVYVCVFMYLYIHNKYTQCTLIYYVNKLLFWMRLITINRLTALFFLFSFYISVYFYFSSMYVCMYVLELQN